MTDTNSDAVGPDAMAEVDRILRRAGLPVSEEERRRLAYLYPAVEESCRRLRLAETRYAEPALIYPAADAR